MYLYEVLEQQIQQTIRETHREMRRVKIVAAADEASIRSSIAHCDALSRGERPGPGWWEVAGGRHPRWRGEKLVMSYRLPRLPEAKRAREGGE